MIQHENVCDPIYCSNWLCHDKYQEMIDLSSQMLCEFGGGAA